MYLYYEMCEKLWGGSPATEQIEMGIETEEVNQQVDANQQVDVNEQMGASEREDSIDGTLKSKQNLLAAVAAANPLLENQLQKIPFNANDDKH